MIDIRKGDYLVIGPLEYPVRGVEAFGSGLGLTPSFRRKANLFASTKRAPAMVGGKRGPAAVNLADVRCTPLDPLDAETKARLGLGGPAQILETFVASGKEYVRVYLEDLTP